MNWHDETERARFLTALRALAEIHERSVSEALCRLYHSTMEQHDIADVLAAFRRAATELTFFPKPAELLQFLNGAKGDHKVEGERQAQEVLMAVRRYGKYATVQFSDPVTNAVLRSVFGGWPAVCGTKEDAVLWFVKDFSERYAEYKLRGEGDVEPLRGLGSASTVDVVGGCSRPALPGNAAAQAKVKRLVGGLVGR